MFAIYNKPAATQDLLDAIDWYELQQKGLGEKFIEDLEDLLYYMELNPRLFPMKYKYIREAKMKRFPYVLLFKLESDHIVLLSVFNCYQNPKKKAKRIK